MKLANRFGVFLIAVFMVAVGAAIFSMGVGAQEEGWQIVRADYGFRNQRNDVTDILKDLVGRGAANGQARGSDDTRGGEREIGKDKPLHILAKSSRNEELQLNYSQGGFLE